MPLLVARFLQSKAVELSVLAATPDEKRSPEEERALRADVFTLVIEATDLLRRSVAKRP